jgi:hypothetical protein
VLAVLLTLSLSSLRIGRSYGARLLEQAPRASRTKSLDAKGIDDGGLGATAYADAIATYLG